MFAGAWSPHSSCCNPSKITLHLKYKEVVVAWVEYQEPAQCFAPDPPHLPCPCWSHSDPQPGRQVGQGWWANIEEFSGYLVLSQPLSSSFPQGWSSLSTPQSWSSPEGPSLWSPARPWSPLLSSPLLPTEDFRIFWFQESWFEPYSKAHLLCQHIQRKSWLLLKSLNSGLVWNTFSFLHQIVRILHVGSWTFKHFERFVGGTHQHDWPCFGQTLLSRLIPKYHQTFFRYQTSLADKGRK